jgi:hypothetical protein
MSIETVGDKTTVHFWIVTNRFGSIGIINIESYWNNSGQPAVQLPGSWHFQKYPKESFSIIRGWRAWLFAPGWKSQSAGTGLSMNSPASRQRQVFVPWWPIALILLVLWLMLFIPFWKKRNRIRKGLCVKCGYDLRATPGRCPECGHTRESLLRRLISRLKRRHRSATLTDAGPSFA